MAKRKAKKQRQTALQKLRTPILRKKQLEENAVAFVKAVRKEVKKRKLIKK